MAEKLVSWSKPEPFKIKIPEKELERLKAFCELTDYSQYLANVPEQDPDSFARFGLPPSVLMRLFERLKSGYDWREAERELNAMGEHVKIKLHDFADEGEYEMHAVVVRSKDPNATPLLACHGWPGDFSEFKRLAPLLASGTPAFHVVCPSLPGFTFSQAPKSKGITPMNITKVATAVDAVIRAVFNDDAVRYVAQAGDLGSATCRRVSQLFPERCRGIHLNYASLLPKDCEPKSANMTEAERRGHERGAEFRRIGSAYQGMNKTVPYTLGAMLSSSPLACIAYLGEKHFRWSSPDKPPSDDEVLTHCLLYWFTGSLTSSVWLYRGREPEADGLPYASADDQNLHELPVTVPTAFCFGWNEISWCSRANYEPFFHDIRRYTVLSKGSHFLAREEPQMLAEDLRAFVKSLTL